MPLFGSGLQGNQGNQGFQGFQGNLGPQGLDGFGLTGATGYQGNPGLQGAQGAQGPQQLQGFQGNTGNTGSSGLQGNLGKTGNQGLQGHTGSQGPKGIILPVFGENSEEYVQLACVEMPEVRFEDTIEIIAGNTGSKNQIIKKIIDDYFVQVCEPNSIIPIGITTSIPVLYGANVIGNKLFVEIEDDAILNKKVIIQVVLSGIRKGAAGRRFARRTYEEVIKNNKFWNAWKE